MCLFMSCNAVGVVLCLHCLGATPPFQPDMLVFFEKAEQRKAAPPLEAGMRTMYSGGLRVACGLFSFQTT